MFIPIQIAGGISLLVGGIRSCPAWCTPQFFEKMIDKPLDLGVPELIGIASSGLVGSAGINVEG